MRFGRIDIDPAKNPAVLDTATWDPESAWNTLSAVDESHWKLAERAIRQGRPLPQDERCLAYPGSCGRYRGSVFFLATLPDAQQVIVELRGGSPGHNLGMPIGTHSSENDLCLTAYPTDAATVDGYVRTIRPDKGPKALGAIPRLGIGSRMSTTAWPGVWRAMKECDFCANPIQNSVREVNLLEDVLTGRTPRRNYLHNFGTLEEGHSGSTFEGLWVAGVLDALKADSSHAFGADADHITVRRGAGETDHAERVIQAARLYTFFTLDVSDILDYAAMSAGLENGVEECSGSCTCQAKRLSDVIAYHSRKRCIGRKEYGFDEAVIVQLIGKYGPALDVVGRLSDHISSVRDGAAFDLELSIDETPSGIDPFGCLTTERELTFLALEMRRRQIPLTHIAPNLGVEKGLDYRGSDGLSGLERRVRALHDICREFGLMLDCHSGDDLASATRQAIGRATQGHCHFKVSPFLQVIFAETLTCIEPARFQFWWDDTIDYARKEAAAGSDFAAACIRQYEDGGDLDPSPHHSVFHYYNFASVGRRDERGQFVHRERFYDLSADFYREYQGRVYHYLCELAQDVFGRR